LKSVSLILDYQTSKIYYEKNQKNVWLIEFKALIFASAFDKQLFLKQG